MDDKRFTLEAVNFVFIRQKLFLLDFFIVFFSADILPSNISTMRKKAKEKEDLPLPVLPQMPT